MGREMSKGMERENTHNLHCARVVCVEETSTSAKVFE